MLLEIFPHNIDTRKMKQVVDCLRNGGLVIYPTDTVYGLGCDIFNKEAVEKICRIKTLYKINILKKRFDRNAAVRADKFDY